MREVVRLLNDAVKPEVIGATRIFVPVIGLADGIIDDLYLKEKND